MMEWKRFRLGGSVMARNWLGAAEWGRLVEQWKESGLSLPKFCQQRGIKKGTMSGWVYKPSLKRAIEASGFGEVVRDARPAASRPSSSPAFVPVRLREPASVSLEPAPASAIEVILGSGRRVIVPRGFDAQTLRQVLAVLESSSC